MSTNQRPTKAIAIATLVIVCTGLGFYLGQLSTSCPQTDCTTTPTPTRIATSADPSPSNSDDLLQELFDKRQSDVAVTGVGTVTRLLDDDNDGSRHQRFVLQLNSGQTLLIAHNIDVAPRLDGLRVGDRVGFSGDYIYSDQGGTIHWTHHDPAGRHKDGWLEWNGQRYD